MTKHFLRSMKLDEIYLVDKGANEGARVVLAKRDVSKMLKEEGGKFVVYSADGKKKLGTHDTKADAVAQLQAIEANKQTKKSFLSKMVQLAKDCGFVSDDSEPSGGNSEDVHEWVDMLEVGKVGAKISAARMEKIKAMYQMLGDMMAEQGQAETKKHANTEESMSKIDVSKLAPEVQAHIAEMEKQNAEVLKRDTDAIIAKAKAEADARVSKAEADAKEAVEVAKAERDARLNREYAEKVSIFKRLPIDKNKDGAVLREIDEKCSPDVAKRVHEILKAADAAMTEAGILMTQIGSNGESGASADAQLQAMAKKLVSEGKADSIAKGYTLAMSQDPELSARAQREAMSN